MKKVLLKKIVTVCLAAVMLLGVLAMGASAAEDPVNEARGAVVKVVHEIVITVDGVSITVGGWVGSGMLLATESDTSATSTNLALTAYHVVDETFDVEECISPSSPYYEYFAKYDGIPIKNIPDIAIDDYILLENDVKIGFTVDKNAKSEQSDWALLRLDQKLTNVHALKVAKSSEMLVNDAVWALGFPADLESVLAPTYNKTDVIVTDGIISKIDYKVDLVNSTFIMHTAALMGGNSGGPLVDENGNIVGINVRAHDNGDYSLALPIDEVIKVTEKLGINILIDDGSSDMMMWIIIAAVALVVIAGIVVLIVVLAKRGKSKQAAEPEQLPYLVIQSGRLAGQRYRIEGNVKIGRDGSQCNVVYPTDTAGVSGTHCEVFTQNGAIYLRDLKSSYGTFLGNGMKLQPGVAIMITAGSTFYLASPENTFMILY